MDSLSDHTSRRSTRGRGSDRGSGGPTAAINRFLLLAGALLFINGISVTLIAALIPFAISSAIVVTFVTFLTAASALAYIAKRNPARTLALVETARPLVEILADRDRARRQGGL
jgi:protein-S-isoprenylcysteine O-methyltransferase Ste14